MLGFLISAIIFLVVGLVVGFVVYRRVRWESSYKKDRSENAPSIKAGVVAGILGLLGVIAASGITDIPPGNVGVLMTWNKVNEVTLPSGVSYVVPIMNRVVILNTQVQAYDFADIEGATSDLQAVRLSGSVNYRIDANTAWRLYRDVGQDFAGKIFTKPADTALKTITPRYTASVIISKRDEIAREATKQLVPALAQYGISVEAFYVVNIGLNPAFMEAVEQKQIADQQVLIQQQITRQKEEQKKQAKAEAEGRADAQRAQAAGEADAIRALAEAQADANRELAQSITPELIQYNTVQKLSPTIQTMLLPSDGNFLLNLPGMLGQ